MVHTSSSTGHAADQYWFVSLLHRASIYEAIKGLIDAKEAGSIEAQEIECQQSLEQDEDGDEITKTLVRSLMIPHDHPKAGT